MLIHRAILKLIGAASKDSAHYQLCGIYFQKDGEKIRACATSGKLLAEITQDQVPEEMAEDFPTKVGGGSYPLNPKGVILHTRLVAKIAKIVQAAGKPFREILNYLHLRQYGDEVEAEVVDSDLESTRITGKPIDGTFPDYRQVTDKPVSGLKVRLNPRLLVDGTKLLLDLVKELGEPSSDTYVTLEIPDDVDEHGHVTQPIQFVYNSPDRTAVARVLVMPFVER